MWRVESSHVMTSDSRIFRTRQKLDIISATVGCLDQKPNEICRTAYRYKSVVTDNGGSISGLESRPQNMARAIPAFAPASKSNQSVSPLNAPNSFVRDCTERDHHKARDPT